MKDRASMAGAAMAAALIVAMTGSACMDESREAAADHRALALLAQVTADGYPDWARMPGFESPRRSVGSHGPAVEVFVNRPLAEAIESGGPWPVGAIAIKDAYDDGDLAVRAMLTRDDGGWFFAQFDADDRIVTAGGHVMCNDCHNADSGYILSAPEPTPEPDVPADTDY